jgi:HAD superfamily hydrolase (TIGR01509 family)
MINTVIFDMDGLLIDSEPLWQKAGMDTLKEFDIHLTLKQYHETTGLRTSEWIDWWFSYYEIDKTYAPAAIRKVEDKAIEYIRQDGEAYPGTKYILDFFQEREFNIGLATSSPLRLVDVVVEKLQIGSYFKTYSSAEFLAHGKPHPEVYMNCANALNVKPQYCICFEDSFNGMIAAKAAKMKCVVVPAEVEYEKLKWFASDYKIARLNDFDQSIFEFLTEVEAESKTSLR